MAPVRLMLEEAVVVVLPALFLETEAGDLVGFDLAEGAVVGTAVGSFVGVTVGPVGAAVGVEVGALVMA